MPETRTFRYEAVAADGRHVAGQIDAADEAAARDELSRLGLAVRRFEGVVPPRASPLGAADFAAFNEQLAHLARAGLPVERGLRLVAQDLSRGRLRRAVEAVVHELESGATLPIAIDRHRDAFPRLYANVVEAGIRVGNLPAALFNLGRHVELGRRLRASLSRALAYPTVLLLALVCVAAFLSAYVLPLLTTFYIRPDGHPIDSFQWSWTGRRDGPPPTAPWVTIAMLAVGRAAPAVAAVAVAAVACAVLGWPIVRRTAFGARLRDDVFARLPLVGPAVRFGLVGRWCDAVRIGVEAGLDVPAALALGGDTIGSPGLSRDTAALVDAASRGAPLAGAAPLSILPATVPATLDLATQSQQLPRALATLADLYLRQADARARAIPIAVTPALLLAIACVMGAMIAAIFVPVVRLLNATMG